MTPQDFDAVLEGAISGTAPLGQGDSLTALLGSVRAAKLCHEIAKVSYNPRLMKPANPAFVPPCF